MQSLHYIYLTSSVFPHCNLGRPSFKCRNLNDLFLLLWMYRTNYFCCLVSIHSLTLEKMLCSESICSCFDPFKRIWISLSCKCSYEWSKLLFKESQLCISHKIVFFAGLPRRLRGTTLLWKGKTKSAINLLQDDVLVADPGTK